ncbi:MAG TPA: hypothetical protein VG675_00315 [Bryobacteraceae bacterium]|nr:hypothetical protein [Bryobacteraceae bacterium]
MSKIVLSRGLIALLLCAAAFPAAADTRFTVARMTRTDVPFGKGQCDIRLQVDGEVEVSVRGDSVVVRTISGRDATNDGSECNAPLPANPPGFNFEVIDRRGDIALAQPPSRRNNFTAVVRIRDSQGGYGRYHFRLSWQMNGVAGRPGPAPAPGFGAPSRGFGWNDTLNYRGRGRGQVVAGGMGRLELSDASVLIDRTGRVTATFRASNGRTLTFAGNIVGANGDVLRADVSLNDRVGPYRGVMSISTSGRRDVNGVSFDATAGRDRMQLNWNRR